jgi:DNA-binding LacI/PurR family transcriptional regulator
MKIRNKRITIKDVALSAGVSIGTVSRFIRNRGYVGEGAKGKIAAAIRELQYVPSAAARSMINKDSQIIGIAVPEINNPFLADLVVKIEAGLSRKNYSIMMCNTGYSCVKIERFIDDLIMRDADGVVMVATQGTPQILEKMKAFMHGVMVGRKTSNFDSIDFDDRKAAYDVASYLIGLGHERIACIGFHVNAPQTIDRRDGVAAALEDRGIQARREYMIGEDGASRPKMESVEARNVGYVYSRWLLELPEPPTAIIAINDFYAIGAYEAIIEKGLRVGKDVSVTGFDDISIAKFLTPSLTTVKYDTKVMAELAVEILTRKITEESDSDSAGRSFTLPSNIALRESAKSPS